MNLHALDFGESECVILFTNIWSWCSRPPPPSFEYQLCYIKMQGSVFCVCERVSKPNSWSKNMACRMWGHEWGMRACVSGELRNRKDGISRVGNVGEA